MKIWVSVSLLLISPSGSSSSLKRALWAGNGSACIRNPTNRAELQLKLPTAIGWVEDHVIVAQVGFEERGRRCREKSPLGACRRCVGVRVSVCVSVSVSVCVKYVYVCVCLKS